MFRMLHGLAVAAVAMGIATESVAQTTVAKRVAMVIGNSKYTGNLSPLDKPTKDAQAIARLLKDQGFSVTERYDLDRDKFEDALEDLAAASQAADTLVLFYAGHGMQIVDTNKRDFYNVLAPTDAEIDCETLRSRKVIRLDEIFRKTKGVPNQIIILDACRNDLFAQCPVRRGEATRGYGFGATNLEPREGEAIMVAFSTGMKAVAYDDLKGKNHSPFAYELITQLKANPNTLFFSLMNRIIVNVGAHTNFRQVPTYALEGGVPNVCLAGKDCRETMEDSESMRALMRARASLARSQTDAGYPLEGMLIALEALPGGRDGEWLPVTREAEQSLRRAWGATRETMLLQGHNGGLRAITFSPDESALAVASEDKAVGIFNARDGNRLRVLSGHAGAVTSVSFSADGRKVLTGSNDRTLRIWDASSGTATKQIAVPAGIGEVGDARYSPDMKSIAATFDTSLALWHAADGQMVVKVDAHRNAAASVRFDGDGRRIVTAGFDGEVVIWDARGLKELQRLKGHTGPVYRAEFNKRGDRIVSASADQTVRVWDWERGAEVFRISGDKAFRSAVFGGGDRERILTASESGIAEVWSAQHGILEFALKGHGAEVFDAVFSADGQRIATASWDQTAVVWQTNVVAGADLPATRESLVETAKKFVPRCLMGAQREWYGLPPDPPAWCLAMKKWPFTDGATDVTAKHQP